MTLLVSIGRGGARSESRGGVGGGGRGGEGDEFGAGLADVGVGGGSGGGVGLLEAGDAGTEVRETAESAVEGGETVSPGGQPGPVAERAREALGTLTLEDVDESDACE